MRDRAVLAVPVCVLSVSDSVFARVRVDREDRLDIASVDVDIVSADRPLDSVFESVSSVCRVRADVDIASTERPFRCRVLRELRECRASRVLRASRACRAKLAVWGRQRQSSRRCRRWRALGHGQCSPGRPMTLCISVCKTEFKRKARAEGTRHRQQSIDHRP
jgi:hypothetical protein